MIYSTHAAKTQFSKLIEQALNGEEVIIARRNEPLVKLVSLKSDVQPRQFGGLKNLVVSMGADFNDELEDFDEYGPAQVPYAMVAEESVFPKRK